MSNFDVIIAGGGLAGLTSSIVLAKGGLRVALLEKKNFPFHKVCGEYISNEVLHFLKSIGFNPFDYGASSVTKLRLSDPSGRNYFISLDLGGFGLSRYTMDSTLAAIAKANGVELFSRHKVLDIIYNDHSFTVVAEGKIFNAPVVIGSYGKRDLLDRKLHREFIHSRTGYMAVKYHVKTDYPRNEVALDNFRNGYCGIVKIEKDLYNICYLYKRSVSDNYHSIKELEEDILFKNPVIKSLFSNSEFVFNTPLVINEISFATKTLLENHVLMCGDSAGLITPLCGNGMSMAIHSGKILAGIILKANITMGGFNRDQLEKMYMDQWTDLFARRLKLGRMIQRFFGRPLITSAVLNTVHAIPALERTLIAKTHGQVF